MMSRSKSKAFKNAVYNIDECISYMREAVCEYADKSSISSFTSSEISYYFGRSTVFCEFISKKDKDIVNKVIYYISMFIDTINYMTPEEDRFDFLEHVLFNATLNYGYLKHFI